MSRLKKAADHYRAANEASAKIILADIDKYGGESAGLVQWARLFLERHQAPADSECGPLFRSAAEAA